VSLELVVDVRPTGIWIALLKDGKLTELHEEQGNTDFSVGDIYLGKVHRLIPSLNAAFIDIGYQRDAFLHYLDLGPQFSSMHKYTLSTIKNKQKVADLQYFKNEKDILKDGKINELISPSQKILVQIAKEAISNKGPRLSGEITLAGRYLVLVPFSSKIAISQKIKNNKEKQRLKKLMEAIKPKNFGVIIRTVAENINIKYLEQDLQELVTKWHTIHANLQTVNTPKRILGEIDKTTSILRDILNGDFTSIVVNDPNTYQIIKDYIATSTPEKVNIIQLYRKTTPIFDRYHINKQIKALFGTQVPLTNGGYLIIEHTEAMHVIDVNSGNRKGGPEHEQNTLQTNMQAAEEIARVLQLRDMGGIICIDFIDMHNKESKKALFEHLKKVMKSDRARHNILPPSQFGIVEITRQRVRPETIIKTSEACPTCNGTGEIQASILLTDEIENNLQFLLIDKKEKKITILLHPYVEAYLTKGLVSKQIKWLFKYKKWIPLKPTTNYHLLQYAFINEKQKVLISSE